MRAEPGIDIVTRLYDLADLPQLDRLLFSIVGQAGADPLRLHVMLQRFSFTEVQAARLATQGLVALREGVNVTLHNWDNAAPFDLSVPLLNWGLAVARGRYVTCLDVGVQLYPHACTALLARLEEGGAAIALGGVVAQPVLWWGDLMLAVPDAADEPSPPPLFLADRSRLRIADRAFRSGEPGAEFQEFIERTGRLYGIDRSCEAETLAVQTRPL